MPTSIHWHDVARQMMFRYPHNIWFHPGIAWVLTSAVFGLSYARNHGLTEMSLVAALAVAAGVVGVAFAVLSVSMGFLLVKVAQWAERRSKRRNAGPSGDC